MQIDAEVARLATLSPAALRENWSTVTGRAVPRVSPSLLRLALAWELQARHHGGPSRDLTRRLDQLVAGKTRTSQAQPGMRLVREWQGKLHVVTIGDDGGVLWDNKSWRSLSEVARAITGTRWSGPAFFGLKHKVAAA